MSTRTKILILDDNPMDVRLLEHFLDSHGYAVLTAMDGKSGLRKISREKPKVVFLDVVLPDKEGLSLLYDIKARNPETVVIVTSFIEDQGVVQEAIHRGAHSHFSKPLDFDSLICVLKEITEGTSRTT